MKKRSAEITETFNSILDIHLEKLISGEVDEYLEIQDIAEMMHIHPTHLSNVIKDVTGKSPCAICNSKTIDLAKRLLNREDTTIAAIAFKLSFEPSNFTKYFKKHTGETPLSFRKNLSKNGNLHHSFETNTPYFCSIIQST